VIPRLSRVYGPTMLKTDSKAIAQFISRCVENEDIILKSEGSQLYSYTYVADAVTGLLYILQSGPGGEAYNIAANGDHDVTLRELASTLAKIAGTSVVFEIPEEQESRGTPRRRKRL